jgi:hypothetical protein
MDDLKSHMPQGAEFTFVEQAEGAGDLSGFKHPEGAIYVLGAEDYGVPEEEMRGYRKLAIATPMCLNVAVAGSIVLYDRQSKSRKIKRAAFAPPYHRKSPRLTPRALSSGGLCEQAVALSNAVSRPSSTALHEVELRPLIESPPMRGFPSLPLSLSSTEDLRVPGWKIAEE